MKTSLDGNLEVKGGLIQALVRTRVWILMSDPRWNFGRGKVAAASGALQKKRADYAKLSTIDQSSEEFELFWRERSIQENPIWDRLFLHLFMLKLISFFFIITTWRKSQKFWNLTLTWLGPYPTCHKNGLILPRKSTISVETKSVYFLSLILNSVPMFEVTKFLLFL